MTYRIEPLAGHDLGAFECGNDDLGEWLRRHARTATGQGVRTYVLVDEDGAVVGYFAVAPHLLDRAEAPSKLARGASRRIPATLQAKANPDKRGTVAAALELARLSAPLLVTVDIT